MTESEIKEQWQELQEQVRSLQLKDKKYEFMLNNMHRICVHHDKSIQMGLNGEPKLVLVVTHAHFLEGTADVHIDAESLDAHVVRLMK